MGLIDIEEAMHTDPYAFASEYLYTDQFDLGDINCEKISVLHSTKGEITFKDSSDLSDKFDYYEKLNQIKKNAQEIISKKVKAKEWASLEIERIKHKNLSEEELQIIAKIKETKKRRTWIREKKKLLKDFPAKERRKYNTISYKRLKRIIPKKSLVNKFNFVKSFIKKYQKESGIKSNNFLYWIEECSRTKNISDFLNKQYVDYLGSTYKNSGYLPTINTVKRNITDVFYLEPKEDITLISFESDIPTVSKKYYELSGVYPIIITNDYFSNEKFHIYCHTTNYNDINYCSNRVFFTLDLNSCWNNILRLLFGGDCHCDSSSFKNDGLLYDIDRLQCYIKMINDQYKTEKDERIKHKMERSIDDFLQKNQMKPIEGFNNVFLCSLTKESIINQVVEKFTIVFNEYYKLINLYPLIITGNEIDGIKVHKYSFGFKEFDTLESALKFCSINNEYFKNSWN